MSEQIELKLAKKGQGVPHKALELLLYNCKTVHAVGTAGRV